MEGDSWVDRILRIEVENALPAAVLTTAVRQADKLAAAPELRIGTEPNGFGKESALRREW